MRPFPRSFLWLLPATFFACGGGGSHVHDMPPVATPDEPPADPVSPPAPRKAEPLPVSGGTLGVLSDGKTAVASDPDREQIYVVDLVTNTLNHTIMVLPGDEPGRHTQDAAGNVHVVLRRGGAVLSFDPQTGKVLARRSLCLAPRGIAFDGRRNLLHVACAGGELVSIAPTANDPARVTELDRDLRDVVVKGDSIYITTFRQATVLRIDAGTGRVLDRGKPPSSLSLTMRTPSSPAVAWRMIDGGNGPIIIHQRASDGEVGTGPGGYSTGGDCSAIVESAVSFVSAGGPLAIASSGAISGSVLPVDVALSPDGKQLAFVTAGNSEAQVRFVAAQSASDTSVPLGCVHPQNVPSVTPPVTNVPQDTLPDPIEYRPANGQIVAVDFDLRGNVVVQSRNPANIQVLTQRRSPMTLSTEGKWNGGHALFHKATKGQLACASCHPEGGDDARTWKFSGMGERRTQSLRGGILDTAPFHWDGNLRDMNTLMLDVFQGRMLGESVSVEGVQTLSNWIDSIPNTGGVKRVDPAAVMRGKALFDSAEVGCSSCHAGKGLTNNTLADVGTGTRLQTPQLMGLGLRAPYMHNGCAKTLKDRFGGYCGGGDRHGITSKLGSEQVDDLISYLETL